MRCRSPYKVFSNGKIPNTWTTFLSCSDSKSELFRFLSTQLLSGAPNDQTVVATDNKMIVSNHDIYLNDMMPRNIEEADEHLLLHILDASKCFDRILINCSWWYYDDHDGSFLKISLCQRVLEQVWQRKIHEIYSSSWDFTASRAADFDWTDFFSCCQQRLYYFVYFRQRHELRNYFKWLFPHLFLLIFLQTLNMFLPAR